MSESASELLRRMFDAAIAAACPDRVVKHLPRPPKGRTIVVGAGKGAAAMAEAVEAAWPGELCGLVVTRYGHKRPTRHIEVVEAGHPMPDADGLRAAERILALARDAGEHDLVLALITGGGSALLTLPAPGISLDDTRAINGELLRCGASIAEINTVRKHLSAIKGGRLGLAAAPAETVTLLISDVPGDDPAVIASGPTVPDRTTLAEAREVLARYRVALPPAVAAHLDDPANETPKPGHPGFGRSRWILVATPRASLEAAAKVARAAGVTPVMLGDAIQGHAEDVAAIQASLARDIAGERMAGTEPRVLLSGGETSVAVTGHGRGGRNTHYLLALAIALGGHPDIHAIACDTDGIDGTEDNAGALIGPSTLERAVDLGMDPRAYLDNNDAYTLFERLGDLVVTGPTLTNVNDFRAILID
ncbi:MAG: glycerate kinase [Rhodospirillales bacterium]|nr:glycerate kinase [Rhodospirillales bacterium]